MPASVTSLHSAPGTVASPRHTEKGERSAGRHPEGQRPRSRNVITVLLQLFYLIVIVADLFLRRIYKLDFRTGAYV